MATTETPSSLGLVGDGDDEYVFLSLEEAFDARLPRDTPLGNLGDLFDPLTAPLSSADLSDGRCLSQHCFYRLRRALERQGIRGITPRTAFQDLIGRECISPLWNKIREDVGLTLPDPSLGWLSGAAVICLTVGGFFGPLALGLMRMLNAHQMFGLILGCWGAAFLVAKIAPKTTPFDCETVGDLARQMMGLNYGRLARELRTYRESDAWEAFTRNIRSYGEGNIDIEMTRSTRLFG